METIDRFSTDRNARRPRILYELACSPFTFTDGKRSINWATLLPTHTSGVRLGVMTVANKVV